MVNTTPHTSLSDLTLRELASHDLCSSMQRFYNAFECVELGHSSSLYAAQRRALYGAFDGLNSLVSKYRDEDIEHIDFGNSLQAKIDDLSEVTKNYLRTVPWVSTAEPWLRSELQFVPTVLSGAAIVSKSLVLGMGSWRTEPVRTVNIGQLLTAIAAMHQRSARAKGLDVIVEAGASVQTLAVHEWVLTTVIGNFVANAIKYTDHGKIVLSFGPYSTGGKLEIAVTDTGIGIDPSEIADLTRAGARGSQVVAEGREGLGLGLTLADLAARAVGADLKFSSELGVGTRASLLLTCEV